MELQGRNLSKNMRPPYGEDVTLLHRELGQLIEAEKLDAQIAPEEIERKQYGPKTEQAVMLFQRQHGLPATGARPNGIVDEQTAKVINREVEALKPDPFEVRGKVATPDGKGVPNLIVRAFDKCVGKENQLGETTTDTDGNYLITYRAESLINPDRNQADLLVSAYSRRDVIEAASPLIINALPQEVVNLALGKEAYRGPDVYSKLHQALTDYLEDVALDEIEPRDLYCLANNTKMNVQSVHHYVRARQWDKQWGELSPEVFFACFQEGMPTEWGALLGRSTSELSSSIESAVENNLVSRSALDCQDKLEAILIEWRGDYVVASNDRLVTQASLGQLLRASSLSEDQGRQLLRQWQTFEGKAADFWKAQEEQSGGKDLSLTLQLGALTRNNLSLIKLVKEEDIQQFSDIARFTKDNWLKLFEKPGFEIPSDIQGADPSTQKQAYAEALCRFTEQMLPTRVLSESLARDDEIDSHQMDRFFRQNPDFEFRNQSIRSYLEEKPEALADFPDKEAAQLELEAMQRVFHISPANNRYAVAKVLWQNKLHSAWAITLRGEEELLDLFKGEAILAKQVFFQAQSAQQMSLAAVLQHSDMKYPPCVALPQPDGQIEGVPDLESLFGGQGYCECKHCLSFFSPSAYLVDLFLYLNKAKLDGGGSVLEKLFERRPDLAHLELDCENAHTILPYIDIVNEVLENAVSPREYTQENINIGGKTITLPMKPSHPVPQTEIESDTLKAFPQHLNPAPYLILEKGDQDQGVFYPWNLPFSLWHSEASCYLQHLDAPRWRLMESILGQQIDEVDIATEYLGLIPAEKEILVDSSNDSQILDQYWGVDGAQVELTQAETFLRQSGLSYDELQQLWTLRYVQNANSSQILEVKFEPESSCQIGDASIENLNNEALSRIHRLCRLKCKTGEKLIELDQALMALGGDINDVFLVDYACLIRIEQALPKKVKQQDILCWWNLIDTYDYPGQDSLYQVLFRNPALNQPVEEKFELNATKDELKDVSDSQLDLADPDLDPDLQALILAALRWNMNELKAVVGDAWGSLSFKFNLSNLSYLYRVSNFCHALRIKVHEYLALKSVSGTTPLLDPDQTEMVRPKDTLAFIERYQLIKETGLDPETLDYLLRHQYRADAPFALGDDETAQILFDLQVQMTKLLNEPDTDDIPIRENLENKLSRLLSANDVVTALQLIENDSELNLSEQEKKDFLDENLNFFPDMDEAKAQLIDDNGLSDLEKRYEFVLEPLEIYLVENTVVQQVSDALAISTGLVEALLKKHLSHPSDPGLPVIQVFFAPGFVYAPEGSEFTGVDFADQLNTVIRLHKIGLIFNNLELDINAVKFIMEHGVEAGLPDLSLIPVTLIKDALSPDVVNAWKLLMALVCINRQQFHGNTTVFDVLTYPLDEKDENHSRPGLFELLSAATGWDINDLNYLSGSDRLNLSYPLGYQAGAWLVEMGKTLSLIRPVGASARQMAKWAGRDVTQAQATSVRHAVKAKYGNEQWLEITSPLRNRIREQQRDALLGFVLHHRAKHEDKPFEDEDDLYGYYLIDPQMSACANTSRTVLAGSSVQLFMQRIQLNLEPGIKMLGKHAEEWKWRKYYRVWEANRKVFLWPENWIEPELRDDKSPFFKELENELLQDELNDETVERAYVNYLYKLDEVARLEICAVHYETEARTLHVFGRTAGNPPAYYYRRWEKQRDWTPWEKVELDIYNAEGVEAPQKGVLLLPVVHNRRLFLFWPVFTLKRDEPDDEAKAEIEKIEQAIDILEGLIDEKENVLQEYFYGETLSEEAYYIKQDLKGEIRKLKAEIRFNKQEIKEIEASHKYYSVKIAYSHNQQGHWKAKKLTNEALCTPYFKGLPSRDAQSLHGHFFIPEKTDNGSELSIRWYYIGFATLLFNSFFKFNSCRNELICIKSDDTTSDDGYEYVEDQGLDWYMKARSFGSIQLLNKLDSPHFIISSLKKEHFKHSTFFFYEDKQCIFFVIPPLPAFQKACAANSFLLQSKVMSGKAGSLNGPAYQHALIPVPEPQTVSKKVHFLGDKSVSSEFFHTSQSDQILIRQGGAEAQSRITAKLHDMPVWRGDNSVEAANQVPGIPSPGLQLASGEYVFRIFYHPYTCLFLKQLNRYGIEGLLNPNPNTVDGKTLSRQLTPDHNKKFNFHETYQPNWNEVNRYKTPAEIITFDYEDAYADYNWELFFHIPLLIATRLHQDQRFESAQKWFHYIFNPTETQGDAPYRFWKIKPFHNYTEGQMQSDMKLLLQGKFKNQIQAWQENPFNPHLLARFRCIAYMKTTVMKYLDNLIAWGDQLFRRDSIESLNEATQLYVLAGQILGKLPVATEAKKTEVKTFSQLAENLDDLGNALVELQLSLQDQADENTDVDSPMGNPDLIPYFCFPPNEKLLAYWDTVADRLFKIRHCMNIQGVVRELPLFQPPIDPALLVRAAASGMDLSSALNDLYAPIPKYRFSVMIQKAQEICQELKSLGGTLLSALEKKDAEALALIRARHETALVKANWDIRANQIVEATHNLEALNEQKEISNIKFENYSERDFMNPAEITSSMLSGAASVTQAIGVGIAAAGGAAHQAPDMYVGGLAGPMGGVIGLYRPTGGDKVGKGISSASKWLEFSSIILKGLAEASATLGSYRRRQEDWDLQCDLAEQELKQIEKQILASEIRIAIAEKEKDNLELQITQSETVADFMKSKYTRKQLYGWMVGQVSSVYFQTYQLAYDIAKQAEKTFQHELGIQKSNYIQFGYWDNLRKGLLAGEKLSLDLKRLEMAYLEQNSREYELTKNISLRQLNPAALLALKAAGTCEVTVPEWLFDLDAAGHYMRRIKNVSLSIPSVTGPYTSVNCTLSLLKSSLRKSPKLKDGEYARQDSEDLRFVDYFGAIQSIVTSNADNDSGMFETNLRDERFLPFEGAGAISTWKLELPSEHRQFDYYTISDVILHVRYTARQGGTLLGGKAVEYMKERFKAANESGLAILFSLPHNFPNEWHKFVNGDANFVGTVKRNYFPYFTQGKEINLDAMQLHAIDGGGLKTITAQGPDLAALTTGLAKDGQFGISLDPTSDPNGEVLERKKGALIFLEIGFSIS